MYSLTVLSIATRITGTVRLIGRTLIYTGQNRIIGQKLVRRNIFLLINSDMTLINT
jgi:hypothetical protein